MSVECWRLYAAMGLALVHLIAASFSFKAQVGNRYTVEPRDEDLQPTGMAREGSSGPSGTSSRPSPCSWVRS